jgi:hypothetical protein
MVTPEGSFDASAGGMKLMHWVVGDELIDLSQLKDRYYDPGLLAKITGFNKEPPRKVEAFKDVKLYPTVQLEASKSDNTKLTLHLVSRGGGIGRIAVRVNGKEVITDARDPELNPDAKEYIRQLDLQPCSSCPVRRTPLRSSPTMPKATWPVALLILLLRRYRKLCGKNHIFGHW